MKPYLLLLLCLLPACSPKTGETLKKADSAEAVIAQYIAARGGAEKMKVVRTATQHIEREVNGQRTEIEINRELPDKLRIRTVLPHGELIQVLHGEKAVAFTPVGTKTIAGKDLQTLKEEALLFPELYYAELGYELHLLPDTLLQERPVYQLELRFPELEMVQRQFYDQKTGLLVKWTDEQGQETVLSDYRKVEGILFPFVREGKQGRYTTTRLDLNPVFGAHLFSLE